jgi:hypothetical protein
LASQSDVAAISFQTRPAQVTSADALKAYNYVKQMKDLWASSNHQKGANIRVVNASYGGGGYSQAESDAINAHGPGGRALCRRRGQRNFGRDVHPHYPSGYSLPNVISVAATTGADSLAELFEFRYAFSVDGRARHQHSQHLAKQQLRHLERHIDGESARCRRGGFVVRCGRRANREPSVNQLRALLAFNGDAIAGLQGRSLTGRRLNVFKSLQAMSEK